MEQVIDYLRLHLAGDEHAAMMMVVEQLRAQTARAEKTERDAAARYDCKGGPGTATPACGGCVTCLHRVIEKAEAQVDPLVMQAASFAVHGALGWGFDPNTVSPASLARAAESLAQEFMTMRARTEKAELDYRGVVENFDLDSLNKAINDARARVTQLEERLQLESMRLAACGVVAQANTPELAKAAREMRADYRSASCDDVAAAVDREMALRAEKEQEWREHLTEKAALVSEVAALRAERDRLRTWVSTVRGAGRAIDNGIEARQAVEGGSYLVREDDVKAVVVKLRAAHDKRNAEFEAMRERAEQAEARVASISGVTREELVAAERAKRADLLKALKEARVFVAQRAGYSDVADQTLVDVDAAITKATT